MARNPSSDPPAHGGPPPLGEVLETDSGRRPLWFIVAAVGFVVFAVFAVWRVTAGDDSPRDSYSAVTTTTPTGADNVPAPAPALGRDSTGPTVFFFLLMAAMAFVAGRIVWQARRIYRASPRHQR